ncbi:MAG: hypothetical protein ACRDQU_22125 [Pseudonocardiaceae bacterium]
MPSERIPEIQVESTGVLAFFTVHEAITEETMHDVGPVLGEWINHLAAHPPALHRH